MTTVVTRDGAADEARYPVTLAALLGLLLVLRVLALAWNRTDLFFDEAQYWTWSLEPAFGYYSKPPLIAWAIGAATSVCGMGEACIRLPAPIFHTAAAAAVYLLGCELYDRRTGFWAALAYATLPAVSLSSGIISTDVPLLLFWTLALWAIAAMGRTRAWWPALVWGLSLGAGLNAKYAMAYILLCLAVWLWFTPARRTLLRDLRLWSGFALGVAMIVPNLVWNAHHGFATFAHTADNANWSGSLFHPLKALEFLGSQFGVFGPILFGALLVIAWRARLTKLPEPDRYLLAFTLPIILVVTVQSFLSRSNANWAAPAYMAATVLVIATMLREDAQRWLRASFGIHVATLLLMTAGVASAGLVVLPGGLDPFKRTMGWHDVAAAARAELDRARKAGAPYASIITDERALTAELLYYLPGEPTPVLAWWQGGRPRDHYELTRPFTATSPTPVLLVALRGDWQRVTSRFDKVEPLGERTVKAGAGTRTIALFRLTGFKPPPG